MFSVRIDSMVDLRSRADVGLFEYASSIVFIKMIEESFFINENPKFAHKLLQNY